MKKLNYKRYYFMIVITIIVITIVSQIIIRFHLESQTNDGNKISIAGYQTAVANELGTYSHELVLKKSLELPIKNTENKLKKSLRKLEDRHKALQIGDLNYNLTREKDEEVQKILKSSAEDLKEIKTHVLNLLNNSSEDAFATLTNLSVEIESYAQSLNEVVYSFKKENSSKISKLKFIELILSGIMLSVLLLEIFLVIKPALNKLRESNQSLITTNEKLTNLNKTKSDFLANMSHEIRTPLNGVIGMAHVLEHSELDSKQKTSVQTIKNSALNLLDIINEILDFSKLEAGKTQVEDVLFQLDEMSMDVINLLTPTASSKGLDLNIHIDPKVPKEITSDEGKIRQVLINLIGNAIKFTDKGKIDLHISNVKSEDGFCELLFVIQDSGIGIPENKLETIFESFSQADNSTTRKYGGTGLGLSICKDLVELLNGRIWAENSESGSVFYFTAVVQSLNNLEERKDSITLVQDKKALVLSLDSDQIKMTCKTLTNWGISATPFNQFSNCLEILEGGTLFDYHIITPPENGSNEWKEFLLILDALTKNQREAVLISNEQLELKGKQFIQIESPVRQFDLLDALKKEIPKKLTTKERTIKTPVYEHANSGIKVLVVEDNAINRAVATKSLELLGLPAAVAVDGQEALKLIKSELFDLVLMDIQMPHMDGFETTTAIRKELSQNDQPVIIAMTAASTQTDKNIYIKKGMDDFIPKPLDLDVLNEKIETWFE